jgi:hypothetical protein
MVAAQEGDIGRLLAGLSSEDFLFLLLLVGVGIFSVLCVYASWWHRDWWERQKPRHPILRQITTQRVCLGVFVLVFTLFAWLGPINR